MDNFGAPGFTPDPPDVLAPEGAWTDSRNVRYRDGSVEKCKGYTQALGDLSVTATFAAPISDGTNYFWVYGSNTVLYATDGSTHANISHASLTYAATDDLGWTGGAFHGYMVVTDGQQIPQAWTPSLGNDFTSLTAWPAITCKVIRPYKDFLFALRITTGGNYNPREIRWSDRAQQGQLPGSWDYTDPTNQSGIVEIGQSSDLLVDALPLRDSLIIYKEASVWAADYVGGLDVFGFRKLFGEAGLLAENCAASIGSAHVALSVDDLLLHDGNSARSLIDKRARRWLFNRINTSRYKRSFVLSDYRNREVWVCFPEAGSDWPNLALVWNQAEDSFHVMELGGPKTFGASGIISGASVTFDADTPGTFDDIAGSFDEETYSPFQSRLLLLDAAANRAYQNDSGETYNGVEMAAYAERTGVALTADLGTVKRVTRIWPRVIGTVGALLRFRIGTKNALSEPTSYSEPFDFRIGVDTWLDVRISGRAFDFRVESVGSDPFRLHGVSLEFQPDGLR